MLSLEVQCIVVCPVCGFVCLCGSLPSLEIAFIDPQPNWVFK